MKSKGFSLQSSFEHAIVLGELRSLHKCNDIYHED